MRHQVHVAVGVSGALGDEIVGEGGQELVQYAVGGCRHLRVVFLGVRVCSLPGTGTKRNKLTATIATALAACGTLYRRNTTLCVRVGIGGERNASALWIHVGLHQLYFARRRTQ